MEAGLIQSNENAAAIQGRPRLTCALTPTGAAVVRQVIAALESLLEDVGLSGVPRPRWARLQHELWLGGLLVKRFRRPAANQEWLLNAFEEQGWPERIDDPLPRSRQIDPRQRLHETIKSLNQGIEPSVICFGGDGTGLGVRWFFRMECFLR